MERSDAKGSDTATSLLALALGLLGAILLTLAPLALGFLARGSPVPALAFIALVGGGFWIWRRLAARPTPGTPPPIPRADWAQAEARTALLALGEFTLAQAQRASGLEMARLAPLLDELLEAGELRAELRGEAVVYARPSRSAP